MPLPRAIVCNLCGAQHLKTSFAIHYKSCAKRHPEEYARIQKKVQKRREAKKKAHPGLGRGITGGGKVGLAEPDPLTFMAEDLAEFAEEEVVRYACKVCGRKFLKDRVEKHESICVKLSKKRKRKVYDTGHHRVEGTPFAEFEHHRSETPREILMWRKRGWRRWRMEANDFRAVAGIEESEELERKENEPSAESERLKTNRKPSRTEKSTSRPRQASAGEAKARSTSRQTVDAGTAGAAKPTRKASLDKSAAKSWRTSKRTSVAGSSTNKASSRSRPSSTKGPGGPSFTKRPSRASIKNSSSTEFAGSASHKASSRISSSTLRLSSSAKAGSSSPTKRPSRTSTKSSASTKVAGSSPTKAAPPSRTSTVKRISPTKEKSMPKTLAPSRVPTDENSTAGVNANANGKSTHIEDEMSKAPTSMANYLEREKLRAVARKRDAYRGIAGRRRI